MKRLKQSAVTSAVTSRFVLPESLVFSFLKLKQSIRALPTSETINMLREKQRRLSKILDAGHKGFVYTMAAVTVVSMSYLCYSTAKWFLTRNDPVKVPAIKSKEDSENL